MFRLTIRELMLVTLSTALSVGWWLDNRRHAGAAEEARFLANVAEHGCHCQLVDKYSDLLDKYGVESKWRFDEVADWETLMAKRREKAN